MLSTGQVSYAQGISLCTSVVSLSWGAARAFMIKRTKDEADPDPQVGMLALNVWPFMLVTTVVNLLLLVCWGGILGGYIFPCLVLNFLIVFTTLKMKVKLLREARRSKDFAASANDRRTSATKLAIINETASREMKSKTDNDDKENVNAEVENEAIEVSPHRKNTEPDKDVRVTKNDTDDTALITASLCAVWIPCVVGKSSSNIFLTSAIASLVAKVAILAVAICLSATNTQHHLQKHPFLLLCRYENSTLLDAADVTKCSFTDEKYIHCFSEREETVQDLSDLAGILSKMDKVHKTHSEQLKKLRGFGSKSIKLRSFSQSKLSEQIENITVKKFDEAREANFRSIRNLKEDVKKELLGYGVGIVQQKIRVCDAVETVLQVSVLSVLIVAVLLAALSTVALHKITDYKELFKRYLDPTPIYGRHSEF